MNDMKEKIESAMADIALGDDTDDGEAAAMEDSDLEDENDEVAYIFHCILSF